MVSCARALRSIQAEHASWVPLRLASNAILVAVEPMRVGRQDAEVAVGDVATVQVGRRGRDADIGIGWVAVPSGLGRGSRLRGRDGHSRRRGRHVCGRRRRRSRRRGRHVCGPRLAVAGRWRPEAALLRAGVWFGLLERLLVLVGHVVSVLEGVALGDHLQVEEAAVREPEVAERSAIPIAIVLARVGLERDGLAVEQLMRLRRGLAAKALDWATRIDDLGRVDADESGTYDLTVDAHVNGVTVDHLD